MSRFIPLAALFLAAPVGAQCYSHTVQGTFHEWVNPVQIEGDVLFAGHRMHERTGSTWVETGSIHPLDTFNGDGFGFFFDLDGTRLAGGAYRDDDQGAESGSVYLFEKSGSGWPQVEKIVPSSLVTRDWFGGDVGLEGDTLMVGAPGHPNAQKRGRVFVFEEIAGQWTEVAQLLAFGGTGTTRFGSALALDGNTLAVTTTSFLPGVWMFERVGGVWTPDVFLPVPGMSGGAGYDALDLEGDRLALGQRLFPLPDDGVGAIRVWERNAGIWGPMFTLTETAPDDFPGLGRSIALDGEHLYAGQDGEWATQWRRQPTGWSLVQRLHPPGGYGHLCWFGTFVDASDGTVAIGRACGFGEAYVVDPSELTEGICWCGDWNSGGQLCNGFGQGGCANSSGKGGILGGCGTASVATDDLTLDVQGLPPSNVGIMFMGAGTASLPLGGGRRCVDSGGVGLFRLGIQAINGAGRASLGPGLVSMSQSLLPPNGQIQAGQTWYFQFWYRDAGGPCSSTSNLSNAVGVTFRP